MGAVFGERDDDATLDTISPHTAAMALRRRAGLCIGLAKFVMEDPTRGPQDPSVDLYLEQALTQVHRGIALVDGPRGNGVEASLWRSQYFNGCCAYGVRMRVLGSLAPEDIDTVRGWVAVLRTRDPGGEHFKKLYDDPDFLPLRQFFDFSS